MEKTPYSFLTGGRFSRLTLRLIGLLLFASITTGAVLGTPAAQPARAQELGPESVTIFAPDAPKLFNWMSDHSMRVDTTNNHYPHIAYGSDHLYYASFNGTAWDITLVDNAPGVGAYASLVLDSNNRPHISYYDTVNGALKYAYFNGSAWNIQFVQKPAVALSADSTADNDFDAYQLPSVEDERAWLGASPDLPFTEVDPYTPREHTGQPVEETQAVTDTVTMSEEEWLAQMQQTNEYQPLSPEEQIVSSQTGQGYGKFTSIGLDAFGYPSIAYYDSVNSDLRYAHWNGAKWDLFTLASAGDVGRHASMVFDHHGYPQISYYNATTGDLNYIRFNGTAWDFSRANVDASDNVGLYTSIAVDSTNNPYISYYDGTNGNLKFARWTGSAWNKTTVDTAGDVGVFSSIAVDSWKDAHISYYHRTNGDLKYALCDASGCATPKIVAANETTGLYSSVDIYNNTPRISYFDASKGELQYAQPSGSSWLLLTVDRSGDLGMFPSVKVGPGNVIHVSYYDDQHDDLKYAKYAGGVWTVSTVDFYGSVGRGSSLALDSTGSPHISYYDDSNQDLKYASFYNGAWIPMAVDTEITVSPDYPTTSLALDPNTGFPRIAYTDDKNDDLRVAFWAGSKFVVRTADSAGTVGLYPSIAISKTGYVDVSYYDSTNRHLRYATGTPDGSFWIYQTPDTTLDAGLYTSLVLDSNDLPHIAYMGDTGDVLKYAYFSGNSWTSANVITAGSVGWFTSLALDSANRAYISYFNYDLKSVNYVNWTGSGWNMVAVDNQGMVGLYGTSIATTSNGSPVIAYYDATNGDLKVAMYDFTFVVNARVFLPVIRH